MSEHYRRAEELSKILARIDEVAPGDLSPDVLAPLDQFHSGGLAATRDLSRLAAIRPGEAALDVGCGVGGPARVLAAEHGARVRAVDLSPAFIAVAQALSQKSGISVGFETADALELPFADGSFDVVWTQHASMNIADKPRLYRELRRVLRPEGRLAFHDLIVGTKPGPLLFPVPWADRAEESFLIEAPALRALLTGCGFRERAWQDRTPATLAYFERTPPTAAPPALGIHLLLGAGFPEMRANLRRNMIEGRLGAVMAVYSAAPMHG